MTYCTQCGASVKEGHKFCSQCGRAVDVAERPASRAEVPQAPLPPPAEPPAFPPQLAGVIEPLPGEKAVRLWRTRYLNYGARELEEGMDGLRESGKGLLIATNHRLLYVHEKGALRTTGYEVLENIPYSSMRGLETRSNEVQVPLKEENALTPRFMDASAVEWNTLKSVQHLGTADLYADLKGLFGWWSSHGAGGEQMVDYSVLKAKADRAGISIPSARCPKCGADVTLPTMGGVARCRRCGGAIFPQDVVKRMRAIIDGDCRRP
ncbi:zinc-ribbon domain-containing protein [Methanomassiliicoccus luminyensis]|uniref:zinc-ribbon domain-containing protein n=1 Tax=Methanomassiliicoccus luminyensis TaxID=1080712 RepID=UPI000380397E|nr:zinc-ribbon domain-containing protein [Methanomassiliicoccus luminyensis]